MKRLFATVTAVCIAIIANAQVGFGIHAGLGLNKVTPVSGYSFKNMTGVTLGAMLDYQTCDVLDIQAELNYSQRGYRDAVYVMDNEPRAEYKIKSSYLELPVIAKFYPFRQIGFNIQAGPQIGVLLDRGFSMENGKIDEEIVEGKDNSMDCGFNVGLGYMQNQWTLDVRYYLGLQKTYNDWHGYKNRGISLTIGYYFK